MKNAMHFCHVFIHNLSCDEMLLLLSVLRFIRYKMNILFKKHVRKSESHLCTCLFHIILLLFAYIALIFCPCQQHLLQLNRAVYIHVQHFVNDCNKDDTVGPLLLKPFINV